MPPAIRPLPPGQPPLARHPAGVFFTLAALIALALPWLWVLGLDDPRMVHLRLGIFGFGGAAVIGYVLTAQRAWTGRPPALPALVLGALWLAARGAALCLPDQPAVFLPPALAVAAAVLWPVVAARRWARLPVATAPLALTLAEAALPAADIPPKALALAMAALILFVGGRAIPAFLATDRQRRGLPPRPTGPLWPGLAALGAGVALDGPGGLAGLALAALWVLWRAWPGIRPRAPTDAANRMLSLAYTGLAAGLCGIAAGRVDALPPLAALHLLTLGAMGPMILAFAARTTMHRPPGAGLRPRRRHWLALALIGVATLARVAAELAATGPWLTLSGLAWSGAWAAFLSAHAAALPHPTPHPVLSAARSFPMPNAPKRATLAGQRDDGPQ